jgi:hypothetical protein
MVPGQNRYAVARFTNHQYVEQALNDLYSAGFSIAQICVVSKDADRDEKLGKFSMSDRVGRTDRADLVRGVAQEGTATAGTIVGSMLGAIAGCFVGLGLLMVPGVGLVVVLGTSGATLVTTLTGAAIGAASCGLIEACAGLEIPKDQAKVDMNYCSDSEYLVMVKGTDEQMHVAESILKRLYSTDTLS